MSATRDIARFVSTSRFEDVPAEAVEKAKEAVLNILGCCVAGARTRIGALHIDLATEMACGGGPSTILGDGRKVSVPLAAYANGNLAFALDFEDTLYYITHPGFITVSSGLAVAERQRSSGRTFLHAVILGYEVMARMGPAMQPTTDRGREVFGEQYHPFAGAVTASKLLGLNEEAIDTAFGIAGTYAPVPSAYKYFGLVADTRPMREVKLGWGWMSMAGTLAAISAHKGFRGGHGILDGRQGFYVMAGSDRCDFPRLTNGLGEQWLIVDNEPKLYPAIARNTPPHLAVAALVQEHDIQPDQVRQVLVRGMQMSSVDDYNPQSEVDAQFSLPYAVVMALLREPVSPGMYGEGRLHDGTVRSLLQRIRLEHDRDADVLFFEQQRLHYGVQIDLTDGRTLTREIEFPRDRPNFGWPEACDKFRSLCNGILPDRQVAESIERVGRLEEEETLEDLVATLVAQ